LNRGEFSAVVVAPTFNNAGTLLELLCGVHALGLPIIVVDDGSSDATREILDRWQGEVSQGAGRVGVVRHLRNRGKGAALLSGFAAAVADGHSHAVTIDTDGQLDPADIPMLLAAARRAPTALILGVRSERIAGCPSRCLLGRRLSNLAVCCECGVRVTDSQCGLRVYPLDMVVGERAARWKSGRFAFETEAIVRAGWAGRPIEQVGIDCRYLPRETRVSHFKPFRDSLRGVGLHALLLGSALLPWTGRRGKAAEAGALRLRGSTRRAWQWLSPMRLHEEVAQGRAGRAEASLGVAIGVFIANLPIYGVQTLASLYVAHRLHLHPIPVVLGSQVSTPPFGVALIAAAIAVGHLIQHGTWVWGAIDPAAAAGRWSMVGGLLLDWVVGSVVVGLACAIAAFVGAWWLLSAITRRAAAMPERAAKDASPAELVAGQQVS